MGLRRKLLFCGRVVRFNLASAGLVGALDDFLFARHALGRLVLVTALLGGGYLIGRASTSDCAAAREASCIEAQAPAPTAPTPVASAAAESALPATAPLALTAAVPAPPATPSLSTAEATGPNPPGTPARGARPLSNDEVREMQAWLKAFGFDPGPLDGVPGSRTMAAVKRYQAARQTEETGLLDQSLLRRVRRHARQS